MSPCFHFLGLLFLDINEREKVTGRRIQIFFAIFLRSVIVSLPEQFNVQPTPPPKDRMLHKNSSAVSSFKQIK
jgi:hypothetical protein